MRIVFGFLLIFAILISFSINQDAFATTYTVKTASGSGVPGCEETSAGCYSPQFLTINKGDTVKFFNTDSAAHTYTSGIASDGPSGVFDSSLVMADATYAFTFDAAGSYDYFCMVHPWMTGVITVKSSGGSTYTPPTPSYTPPTSSGVDWESKYLDVLSDFNEVSSKVGELQRENSNLRSQIAELENTIDNLNALIMEQVKVIYDWVLGK